MSDARWIRTNAWLGAAQPGRSGRMEGEAGVRLAPLDGFALATVIVCEGKDSALRTIIGDRFGLEVPTVGRASFGAEAQMIWSAPGQWLLMAPSLPLGDLGALLTGIAAVTDQSDARALVRIDGPQARACLAKGFAIDLDPSVFKVGSAASTGVAHIAVQIWQTEAAPAYVVSVPRSFVPGFWSWLTSSAAEYGCMVVPRAA